MSDKDEEDGDPSADPSSTAARNSPAGRDPPRCPRCDTPIGLVVSYGPITHEASPCGCPVSAAVLEGIEDDTE
ncbi:hypothetical protein [Natrinema salsiterrestre]|uniref:Small CPxCG-related zinc finger protein n=1 Tax=Natrinema salsiterrestre TaxID=2950540 RepID=A0A9Q4Q3B6_9EURY|nr:hypothetical protein [Natrinema salsiterrestre]MDF9745952.1 hypothetical protein [Natrinema salsiterrestre]